MPSQRLRRWSSGGDPAHADEPATTRARRSSVTSTFSSSWYRRSSTCSTLDAEYDSRPLDQTDCSVDLQSLSITDDRASSDRSNEWVGAPFRINVRMNEKSKQLSNADDAAVMMGSLLKRLDSLIIVTDDDDAPCSVSRELAHKLAMVRSHLQDTVTELEHVAEKDWTRLVDLERYGLNSSSASARAYRKQAAMFPHERFTCAAPNVPVFLCSSAVAAPEVKSKAQIFCNVRLPSNVEGFALTSTRLVVMGIDRPSTILNKVFSRFQSRVGASCVDRSTFVLKIRGNLEYLIDDHELFDYESVREAFRLGQDLQLVVVERPSVPPISPDQEDVVRKYKSWRDPDFVRFGWGHSAHIESDETHLEQYIPLEDLKHGVFRLKVCSVDNCNNRALSRLHTDVDRIFVKTFVFHGTSVLDNSTYVSSALHVAEQLTWMEWLEGPNFQPRLLLGSIPRDARVCCILGSLRSGETNFLAYVCFSLVDCRGILRTGRLSFAMRPIGLNTNEEDLKSLQFVFRSATSEEDRSSSLGRHCGGGDVVFPVITVELEEFIRPVIASLKMPALPPWAAPSTLGGVYDPWEKKNRSIGGKLDSIRTKSGVEPLTSEERQLVFLYRRHLIARPEFLAVFLRTVDWLNQAQKYEAYQLLDVWIPPHEPAMVLELLGVEFADYHVRSYAVRLLRPMTNDVIGRYLLQIVQLIKFETFHNSPLVRFLMERALQNPFQVGHFLFWHIQAELSSFPYVERYLLILEEYLSMAGGHALELRRQLDVVRELQRVSELVSRLRREKIGKDQLIAVFYRELSLLNDQCFARLPHGFRLPINPKLVASRIRVNSCRYMSSKMTPLWLTFDNADAQGDCICMMLKIGDDLRQDILVNQSLDLINDFWLGQGLDLRLRSYKCIAAGKTLNGRQVGLIELIMGASTTSEIHREYGGALGPLKLDTLASYLLQHNKGDKFKDAQDNFIRSCAGYCVATYVLGIGDRHSSNIMLANDGHLFHIDFGHILGNFKTKMGFNRERAPFVFTPEMAYVVGGGKNYKRSKCYKQFEALCCHGLIVLRDRAQELISLYRMMIPARLPELRCEQDVAFLHSRLDLKSSKKSAETRMRRELEKSLKTTWRTIDNLIHNFKHGNKSR